MGDTSQAPASWQYQCWKKYPNSFSEPTHDDWLRELTSLRAEKERAEQKLKDWGELFSAAMCAGIPDRMNWPLLIKEIWPNEWHQDCAAVAFLIKQVYERAERAEAELAACRADAERLDYLIANECQVWECNGRYAVHYVTEHHPATAEYGSARAAIDAARKGEQ